MLKTNLVLQPSTDNDGSHNIACIAGTSNPTEVSRSHHFQSQKCYKLLRNGQEGGTRWNLEAGQNFVLQRSQWKAAQV